MKIVILLVIILGLTIPILFGQESLEQEVYMQSDRGIAYMGIKCTGDKCDIVSMATAVWGAITGGPLYKTINLRPENKEREKSTEQIAANEKTQVIRNMMAEMNIDVEDLPEEVTSMHVDDIFNYIAPRYIAFKQDIDQQSDSINDGGTYVASASGGSCP